MSEQNIQSTSEVCIRFRIHPWTISPRCSASEYKITDQGLEVETVPYRVYSDSEIDQFLKEDRLPKRLAKKVRNTRKIFTP